MEAKWDETFIWKKKKVSSYSKFSPAIIGIDYHLRLIRTADSQTRRRHPSPSLQIRTLRLKETTCLARISSSRDGI